MKTMVKASSSNQLGTCNLLETSQVNKIMKQVVEAKSNERVQLVFELGFKDLKKPWLDDSYLHHGRVMYLLHENKIIWMTHISYETFLYYRFEKKFRQLLFQWCFLPVYKSLNDKNIEFVVKTNLKSIKKYSDRLFKELKIKVIYDKSYKFDYSITIDNYDAVSNEIVTNFINLMKHYSPRRYEAISEDYFTDFKTLHQYYLGVHPHELYEWRWTFDLEL